MIVMIAIVRALVFSSLFVACSSTPASSPAAPFVGGSDGEPSSTTDDAASNCDVPTSAAALDAYLHDGAYRSFPHESAPHPSEAPHAAYVQTYVTAALDASLKAADAQHPQCAAMV